MKCVPTIDSRGTVDLAKAERLIERERFLHRRQGVERMRA